MIISDALHAYANATQPVFSKDDRASTVGASEIGQCIRKIFWIKNEDDKRIAVERDKDFVDSWGARRRGTAFEQHFWVQAMRKLFGKARVIRFLFRVIAQVLEQQNLSRFGKHRFHRRPHGR